MTGERSGEEFVLQNDTLMIRRGASADVDPRRAARELARQLVTSKTTSAIFFCSARYDLDVLASALRDAFGGIDLVGCTTSGEIAPHGYSRHSIVGLSFSEPAFAVETVHVDGLHPASLTAVQETTRALVQRMQSRVPAYSSHNTFAVLLIDGLSGIEEPVLSAVSRALEDISLVGGSAGDDLQFRQTGVYYGGMFDTGRAVLALVHTKLPFEVFHTQHVAGSGERVVITAADPVERVVSEINAEPAIVEYARLFGLSHRDLDPKTLATHPLVVRVGGHDYARSIQRVDADGYLKFYCAIDEGIVLSTARKIDIVADLRKLFSGIRSRLGTPSAVLGFDCIFRRLELADRGMLDPVSELFRRNNVIGFSTYGEQVDAMHLNQTFTGVAFGNAGSS
jgi:hypothetical protein